MPSKFLQKILPDGYELGILVGYPLRGRVGRFPQNTWTACQILSGTLKIEYTFIRYIPVCRPKAEAAQVGAPRPRRTPGKR